MDACACPQVPCNGQPRDGQPLCDLCQVLCVEEGLGHMSSGKVREIWRVEAVTEEEQDLLTRAAQSPTVRRQRTRVTERPADISEQPLEAD
jgi:hypothetical protein